MFHNKGSLLGMEDKPMMRMCLGLVNGYMHLCIEIDLPLDNLCSCNTLL